MIGRWKRSEESIRKRGREAKKDKSYGERGKRGQEKGGGKCEKEKKRKKEKRKKEKEKGKGKGKKKKKKKKSEEK